MLTDLPPGLLHHRSTCGCDRRGCLRGAGGDRPGGRLPRMCPPGDARAQRLSPHPGRPALGQHAGATPPARAPILLGSTVLPAAHLHRTPARCRPTLCPRHASAGPRPGDTGLALGGAGARLLTRQGRPPAATRVLRRLRRLPPPTVPPPTVVGVDDWAQRKGRVRRPWTWSAGARSPSCPIGRPRRSPRGWPSVRPSGSPRVTGLRATPPGRLKRTRRPKSPTLARAGERAAGGRSGAGAA